MPNPVDAIGMRAIGANDLALSVGFNRSPQIQAGPQSLGTSALRAGQGEDIREIDFGTIFTDAVENLQQRHIHAQELGVAAVTGRLEDVHQFTIAASEAKLAVELTSAIRNKSVDAFNEIMRMQA